MGWEASRPAQGRGWQEIWIQILVCPRLTVRSRQILAPLPLCSHLSNGNRSHPFSGKICELAAWESSGRVRPGSTCGWRTAAGGGPRPAPGPRLPRGAGQPGPGGRASPARAEAPTWLSAAAAPFPRSPGTFCANQRPGPTPRQTPGSRPEEAPGRSTAPREPNPRGGGSGSNLNTSPAPPRLLSGQPRGPSAGRCSQEGGKHLLDAETPAGKRRVVGGGMEGPEGAGSLRNPVPARPALGRRTCSSWPRGVWRGGRL